MGIASAGGSLGQFAVVPTGQLLISQMDWTGALWMLSLFVAVAAPLAVFLRGRPAAQAGEHNLQSAIRPAMADRSFHFLFWSFAVCGFPTAFLTLPLPPYLSARRIPPTHRPQAPPLL